MLPLANDVVHLQIAATNGTQAIEAFGGSQSPTSNSLDGSSMPYSQKITFVTDHTQVGGSDLTDFNIVIQGTFPELATVANGGRN